MTQRTIDRKSRKAVEKRNEVLKVLQVEYVDAATFKPNAYNPNRQDDVDFYLMLKSIEEDGFTQPPLIHRGLMEIVDGEHRWTGWIVLNYVHKVLKSTSIGEFDREQVRAFRDRREELLSEMPGLEIPVVFTNMTAEQMRISTLRHNRARGDEDLERSVQVLRDLENLGAREWAQDSLGISDSEMDRLMDDVAVPAAMAAADFGESWVPTKTEGVTITQDLTSEKGRAIGLTNEARANVRQYEERVRQAKTEEELQIAKKEANIFRLVLVFDGAESKLVRDVLGTRPAERVLGLCRYAAKYPDLVAEVKA